MNMTVDQRDTTPAPGADAADGPGQLWPVLAIVWLSSLGTAIVWTGIFFIARQQYHFDQMHNYGLAIAGGVAYVIGALTSGRVVGAATGTRRAISHRRFLALLTMALAAACALAGLGRQAWTLWVFVLVYAPLSGWLWPLLESYIGSGRSGRALARATGKFNIAWASAIPVALWLMAPLLKIGPLWVFLGLGIVQLSCLGVIPLLAADPKMHGHTRSQGSADDQARARRLLHVFRGLLSTSYVLFSLLMPLLPSRLEEMQIDVSLRTPLVSVFMVVRLGMFVLLERWHGWHGRWRTPLWSLGTMVAGFAMAYLAPGPGAVGVGLALFGIGAGVAYCGAIFYAMDVGEAKVDAGGKHEATLGIGYLAGPIVGLVIEFMRRAGG